MNFVFFIIFSFLLGFVEKSTSLRIMEPVAYAFKQQFGAYITVNQLEEICRRENEGFAHEAIKQYYSELPLVRNQIRRNLIRGKSTSKDVFDLVEKYCIGNEDIEFVAQKLFEAGENCFKNKNHPSEESKKLGAEAFAKSICLEMSSRLDNEFKRTPLYGIN
ncbi:uncharacterized protein LOC117172382 isoform X1 [Belonocnema kinseyi]|uniref:uncharacterized protein LOC117172382 isoform X1 n=1 Tax=Belonocnema kinseyi TaxID=2817044 RepID=UPI00143DE089|nr:uncharacterized protein LOC117172382 isoform X1 [Belonocnema kinseyi]XP_033216134.1 uncharacterized protein LOC117172382 isoform X1 [Belonocnema kinseyi]